MATTTHYIFSHYNPEDREALEEETGQLVEGGVDSEEAWQREASHISHRQRAPPPQFIPATISYDEWSSRQPSTSKLPDSTANPLGNTLSGWYRSLTSARADTPSQSNINRSSRASSLPSENSHGSDRAPKTQERRNKNNWFIMKAIQSEPPSSVSAPAPSLADILARDPPPLPSEGKYTPPVWLEIGPSNKGFGMLQRSGWNEGEALGPDVIRRKPLEAVLPDGQMRATDSKGKGKARQSAPRISSRQATVEVKMEDFDEVSELRQVDVIDLTLSDSDSSDESDADTQDGHLNCEDESSPGDREALQRDHIPSVDNSAYARKALLTPIATVLKSDRLGIGLKAKTVGPYKASQKRVTHNAAALAAHVRAAEESRRQKKKHGRGSRGFAKRHKKEEENRKAMIAYLKSS